MLVESSTTVEVLYDSSSVWEMTPRDTEFLRDY